LNENANTFLPPITQMSTDKYREEEGKWGEGGKMQMTNN
jgi:hypothetical protein